MNRVVRNILYMDNTKNDVFNEVCLKVESVFKVD